MKVNRSRVALVCLAGLALLAVIVYCWPAGEPTYQGRSVSFWFKEYAFKTNAMPPTLHASRARRLSPRSPEPDPAWVALQALGPKAVPYLTRQLRVSRLDPIYERVFTNLPLMVQGKLSSPAKKRWRRYRAMDALVGLDKAALPAVPAFLQLLKEPDPLIRARVVNALHVLPVDRRRVTEGVIELQAQNHHADILDIAFELGWEGPDMARLLGGILRSPDSNLRVKAITLLERAGREASPAWEQIVAALQDSDKEVRYMAARSIENIGRLTPQMITALRISLGDSNVMVSNVAYRVLAKVAPQTGHQPVRAVE